MNVKRLNALCIELYKTINELNPKFMSDLFKLQFTNRPVRERCKINMILPDFNHFMGTTLTILWEEESKNRGVRK